MANSERNFKTFEPASKNSSDRQTSKFRMIKSKGIGLKASYRVRKITKINITKQTTIWIMKSILKKNRENNINNLLIKIKTQEKKLLLQRLLANVQKCQKFYKFKKQHRSGEMKRPKNYGEIRMGESAREDFRCSNRSGVETLEEEKKTFNKEQDIQNFERLST